MSKDLFYPLGEQRLCSLMILENIENFPESSPKSNWLMECINVIPTLADIEFELLALCIQKMLPPLSSKLTAQQLHIMSKDDYRTLLEKN